MSGEHCGPLTVRPLQVRPHTNPDPSRPTWQVHKLSVDPQPESAVPLTHSAPLGPEHFRFGGGGGGGGGGPRPKAPQTGGPAAASSTTVTAKARPPAPEPARQRTIIIAAGSVLPSRRTQAATGFYRYAGLVGVVGGCCRAGGGARGGPQEQRHWPAARELRSPRQ